ncbi:MAG: alginate export family protein [Planctomycetota bacterium]
MAGNRAAVAVGVVLAIWAATSAAQAEKSKPAKRAHWSDPLKGIPLGPFALDVGGGLRFRLEHRSDFNQQRYADTRGVDLRSDTFLLQRARLELDLKLGEEAHAFVQLQDARAHGADFTEDDFPAVVHACPFWNPLDLRMAYVEWRRIGGTPLGMKVGRQRIFYADNRIWGPGEWGNVGRYTWDAVKVIVDTEVAEVHGLFANRVRYDPDSFDEHNHRLDAFGAYAMVKALPVRLDLFWVGKRSRPELVVNRRGKTVDLDTHTCGFYIDGTAGNWDFGGTVAHTQGDRDEADVDAWGANARLGYTFAHPWQPRLGAELSYASGDPDPADGDVETFDGVFGAIDKMYGRINFVAWMNMVDYQASLSFKPLPRTKVSIDYHLFRLDEARDAWYWCSGRPARQDPTGAAGKDLGQEIDVIVSYKHNQRLKLMAGYAHFFPGTFIERTGPSPGADWCFVQTQYSF